jgi:hypothetical protein
VTYYILAKDDKPEDAMYDSNILGESSFGSFYPGSGLSGLMNIVEKKPDMLPELRIVKEDGKQITVEQFLSDIASLKVKYNRFS